MAMVVIGLKEEHGNVKTEKKTHFTGKGTLIRKHIMA